MERLLAGPVKGRRRPVRRLLFLLGLASATAAGASIMVFGDKRPGGDEAVAVSEDREGRRGGGEQAAGDEDGGKGSALAREQIEDHERERERERLAC